jgi:hypothetical protein
VIKQETRERIIYQLANAMSLAMVEQVLSNPKLMLGSAVLDAIDSEADLEFYFRKILSAFAKELHKESMKQNWLAEVIEEAKGIAGDAILEQFNSNIRPLLKEIEATPPNEDESEDVDQAAQSVAANFNGQIIEDD